jgi:hypothetical protein
MTKKDIPLDLLKAIEGIAKQNLDLIRLVKEENTYYCFLEIDENSNNFFKIFIDGKKVFGNIDSSNYAYKWKPCDESKASIRGSHGNSQNVIKQFEIWVKLIRELHETPSLHDDNFAKHYSDYYYDEFKIVDDEANTTPFNPEQQDFVENYLNYLIEVIENSNEKIDEIFKADLLTDIKQITTSLPTSTKSKVMKGFANVFGKIYKVSKPLAKEIVGEFKKNIIKKLTEFVIEHVPTIIDGLS